MKALHNRIETKMKSGVVKKKSRKRAALLQMDEHFVSKSEKTASPLHPLIRMIEKKLTSNDRQVLLSIKTSPLTLATPKPRNGNIYIKGTKLSIIIIITNHPNMFKKCGSLIKISQKRTTFSPVVV